MHKNVLVIAGSDSGGGAGLQGDIKTLAALRIYSASVVTAVTAQNTEAVEAVFPIPMSIVAAQIEAVCKDIKIHAVKIGMLATAENVEIVATLVESFALPNVVVDPVLKASVGGVLLEEKGLDSLKVKLFPLATIVTPNLDEASRLTGIEVHDVPTMQQAAEALFNMGPRYVVVKGGHLEGRPMDLLYDGTKHSIFDANRIATRNTHGLGDAFSSVLAARLAEGEKPHSAIDAAKKYIAKAVNHPFEIGHGPGPINHGVPT